MAEFVPRGVMTALVTPFHPDGSINWKIQADLIDRQVQAGVSGVAVTAGAGEYVTLQPEERAEVVRRARAALRGRVALVAGVLATDTGSAVSAARAAREGGADAILLLTPYYVAPSADGLVDHFRVVAGEVGLPILLYNNPSRTGINLDLPVLERLAGILGVVGIKECDRDLGRVAHKINRLGAQLAFLSGDDDLCLPMFSLGAPGAIMAAANLVASWAVGIYQATQRGQWDAARQLFYSRLLKFIALYRGPDHPGPLKQAMGLAGWPVGVGRPPLTPLGEQQLAQVREGLKELELV